MQGLLVSSVYASRGPVSNFIALLTLHQLYKLSNSSFVIFSIIPLVRLSGSRTAPEQYDPKWIHTFSMFCSVTIITCSWLFALSSTGTWMLCFRSEYESKMILPFTLWLTYNHYSCWSLFLATFCTLFLISVPWRPHFLSWKTRFQALQRKDSNRLHGKFN